MNRLIIAAAAIILSACATSQSVDHSAASNAAANLNAQFNSGQITLLEREQGFVYIVQTYYPNDALSLNCHLERMYLTEDYVGKKISKAQYEQAYTASVRQCTMATNERSARLAEQNAERQRLREAAAGAAFLNGAGRGVANAYGQNVSAPAQPNYGYQPGGGCIYKAGVLVCP